MLSTLFQLAGLVVTVIAARTIAGAGVAQLVAGVELFIVGVAVEGSHLEIRKPIVTRWFRVKSWRHRRRVERRARKAA